jgi:hypothetical protein
MSSDHSMTATLLAAPPAADYDAQSSDVPVAPRLPAPAALNLLSINGEALSIGQILRYYHLSGKLMPWLRDIVEQHTLFQALQTRSDLDIATAEFEQRIVDFRVINGLTDASAFEAWLTHQNLSRELFQTRVLLELKLEKLKAQLAAPEIEALFAAQQPLLNCVEVTILSMSDADLAAAVSQQVQELADWETIVQSHVNHPAAQGLTQNTLRFGQLSDDLRNALQNRAVGELVGPIQINDRWALFRIDAQVTAQLEGNLKDQLEAHIFQAWLNESVEQLTVQFLPTTLA